MKKITSNKNALEENKKFFNSDRFKGIKRLYSERQVTEQQGTIYNDYSIAKNAANDFFQLLREKYDKKDQITTYGPNLS